MYKKQVRLLKIRLKTKNRSHRHEINRSWPRRGHKYNKYIISQYNDGYMY